MFKPAPASGIAADCGQFRRPTAATGLDRPRAGSVNVFFDFTRVPAYQLAAF
jgi:hypothetical protein